MTSMGGFKIHPSADRFPMMDEARLASLSEDIKKNGLIEPVVLTADEQVMVDGRNRWKACKKANVEPKYHKLSARMSEAAIVEFIASKNMERRDLNPGQRAILAVQLLRDEEKALGSDFAPNGKFADRVAKRSHIGGGTILQAVKVIDNSDGLTKQVMAGELSLNDAYQQIRSEERRIERPERSSSSGETITLVTHLGEEVAYPKPKGRASFNQANEPISWASWTWNPVTGCLHGCKYCYAREIATMSRSTQAFYPVGFTPLFHHERLDAPANQQVPDEHVNDPRLKRVFVCSMADLYGKWVPDEWIEKVHSSCIENPQWDYLFLTKFPRRYVGMQLPPTAWLGTSVDEQKRVRLAEEAFRQISGVRVKWLSLEPLLAPLEFSDLSMFDWIVIGSQTGTRQPDQPGSWVAENAPPFEWVARLVAQAREAGCRVYLKPNLLGYTNDQSPGMILPQEEPVIR